MVTPKRKHKFEYYLLNLTPPPPAPNPNIVHCIISKPLKKIPNFIPIKPTQSLSPIKLLY